MICALVFYLHLRFYMNNAARRPWYSQVFKKIVASDITRYDEDVFMRKVTGSVVVQ